MTTPDAMSNPESAPSPLARPSPSSTFASMTVEDHLRAQDWARISAKLTAITYVMIRRRSWALAHDHAQEAITQAFEHGKKGWNPEKEPVMKYLLRVVWGLQNTERKRRHHTTEVVVEDEVRDNIASPGERLDVTIERRNITEAFQTQMLDRLTPDRVATMVFTLHVEAIDTAADQAAATALPIEEIRRARRRVFDHAEVVARELGMEEVTL